MGNSVVRYAEVGSEENAALKRRLPCLRWCFPDPSPEEKWEYVYRRFLTEVRVPRPVRGRRDGS